MELINISNFSQVSSADVIDQIIIGQYRIIRQEQILRKFGF